MRRLRVRRASASYSVARLLRADGNTEAGTVAAIGHAVAGSVMNARLFIDRTAFDPTSQGKLAAYRISSDQSAGGLLGVRCA